MGEKLPRITKTTLKTKIKDVEFRISNSLTKRPTPIAKIAELLTNKLNHGCSTLHPIYI